MRNERSGTALYGTTTAVYPRRSSALAPNTGETGPMIHLILFSGQPRHKVAGRQPRPKGVVLSGVLLWTAVTYRRLVVGRLVYSALCQP
jgi:hypothetical protein